MFGKKEYDRIYYKEHKERMDARHRRYDRNHKEKVNQRRRMWYLKNREKALAYQKKYYNIHKKECNLRTLECHRKHKDEIKAKCEEYRKMALELIGNKCLFCNSIKHLSLHEIHGKEHGRHHGDKYYIEHWQDFIPVCWHHHFAIHHLSELNDGNLELLNHYVKILGNRI